MSYAKQQYVEDDRQDRAWPRLLFAAAAVIVAVAIGLVALERGKVELLFLLIGTVIAGYASLSRPNTAIYIAVSALHECAGDRDAVSWDSASNRSQRPIIAVGADRLSRSVSRPAGFLPSGDRLDHAVSHSANCRRDVEQRPGGCV